jgi:hypothetical protein
MSDTEGIQSGGTSQRSRRHLDDLDGSDSEAELEDAGWEEVDAAA